MILRSGRLGVWGVRRVSDFRKGMTGAERYERGIGETKEDAIEWSKEYIRGLSFEKEEVKVGRKGVINEAQDHLLRVGLFGAANVGKSRLFNALVETQDHQLRSVIHGATSDCKTAEASLGRMYFTAVDTPGVSQGVVMPQVLDLMATVDLAILVVDVKRGITADDLLVAQHLHAASLPTIVVANKADLGTEALTPPDLIRISVLGSPIYVSATNRSGLGLLQDLLAPYHALREADRKYEEWDLEDRVIQGDPEAKDELADRRRVDRPLRISIVGQANVGKSTLFNALLGYDRMHVTPVPGTTRDNVMVSARHRGMSLRLMDSPGFNFSYKDRWLSQDPSADPQAKKNEVEYWMHRSTTDACRWASVVLFVFDARVGLSRKVINEVEQVMELGRPVILVANKWDEVEAKSETAAAFEEKLKTTAECKHCTVVCVSAKNGTNMGLLTDTIMDHYRRWHTKISTGKLNLFWHKIQQSLHIPKTKSKVRHLIQLASSPPTFALFLNRSIILQQSLARFLVRKIRAEFNLRGVPIRLIQRRKPPSAFRMLGYTNPEKIYKNPPTQMTTKWTAWERGATEGTTLHGRKSAFRGATSVPTGQY